MKTKICLRALFAGVVLILPVRANPPDGSQQVTERASLEEKGVGLGRLVESFVERGEIVGAELLIVHAGKPVVHRVFGYADTDENTPMREDSLFALRSMTKPFTGTAAQLLIEEGKLELDAPVARYLASFDNQNSGAITVRQLLTHRAGFPLSIALGKPLTAFDGGLREIADLAGTTGPAHPPGSRFEYSDTGSDVLGSVVATVAGEPLETFILERILAPMGLRDTVPEAEAATEKWRGRVPARYVGVVGSWTRYWRGTDAPLYPFLKGSGGLFSTAGDYARFLDNWMKAGTGSTPAFLRAETVSRALSPSAGRAPVTTGFRGATSEYGEMWMLYRESGSPEIFAFGHSGSDGTHAYAFPKLDLIVCYFTQTRGHLTAARFEEALGHLFLKPDAEAFARLVAPPEVKGMREYTGLYTRDGRAASLAAVVELEGALMLEFPGRMLLKLRSTEKPDHWVPERMPNDAITFLREGGRVAGLAITRGGKREEIRRFAPDASLPAVEELMSLRERGTRGGELSSALPLRVRSVLEQNGARYLMTDIFMEDGSSYSEIDLGNGGKMRTWVEGERAWRQMPGAPVSELRGLERSEAVIDRMTVLIGDWRRAFQEIVVLSREKFQGRDVFRVRTSPRDGLASTRLVDADDGSVQVDYSFSLVPGAGLAGMERRFEDWRVVEKGGGLRWPFAQTVAVAGGRVRATVSEVDVRVQLDPQTLARPEGAVKEERK